MLSRIRILSPLRHRDFRLLWIGMTVSLFGDGMFIVALAWQAYELKDAPSARSELRRHATSGPIPISNSSGRPRTRRKKLK